MFLRCIFSKALWGLGRAHLLRSNGISCGSLKIWYPRADLWPELRKEPDWFTSWLCSGIELFTPETVQLFLLPKAVLPPTYRYDEAQIPKQKLNIFKGTLMQIWKSLEMLKIHVKVISWKFCIINPKNFRVIHK